MTETALLMGSFQTVDEAADALDHLREIGVGEGDITVVSGLPYSHKALGRPHLHTWMPAITLGSAAVGLVAGLLLTTIVPNLYRIRVGGQPIVPVPTTAVLVFEFTMLFLILGTFVGAIILNSLPSDTPEYDGPAVSDDSISLLCRIPAERLDAVSASLEEQGAGDVHVPQGRAA